MSDDPERTVLESLRRRGARGDEVTVPSAAATGPRGAALGRYPIVGELGAGGMGEVLAVSDESLGRVVAAKVIRGRQRADTLRKFVLEARVTGQLEHPGIPPVHELGITDDDRLFFTMKRVQGQTLGELLEGGRTSLSELLEVFVKVCDAMAFAHAAGVVHRDLKPDNVMVGAFGEVLVMDWGLAKLLGGEDEVASQVALEVESRAGASASSVADLMTLDGDLVGTPAYMAPEQAEGRQEKVDERTDVYALGVVLYQLLCGETPYTGGTVLQIIAAIGQDEVELPSRRAPERAVPHDLEAIAMKAIASRPHKRYQSVRALSADVRAVLEGRLVAVARYSAREVVSRWLRRNRVAAAVLLTCLLGGVVAAGLWGLAARERALEHGRQVAAAQGRLAEVEQVTDPAGIALMAQRAPAALREKRVAPTAEQRARFSQQIQALQRFANALGQLDQLQPTLALRERRCRALLLLARVASLSDDFAAADLALGQARELGVMAADLALAERDLGDDRQRRLAHHAGVIAATLAAAQRGELAADWQRQRAILRLAAFREPQTTTLLIQRLEALSAQLGDARAALLIAVEEPNEAERGASAERLELRPLLAKLTAGERRLALGGGGAHPLSPAERALFKRGLARCESRAAAGGQRRRFEVLAGERQGEAVFPRDPEHAEVAIICAVLGDLGDTRAIPALARYVWAEQAERRAVPAGLALIRFAETSAQARAALIAPVMPVSDGASRWRVDGEWWRALTPFLPAGLFEATGAADDDLAALRRLAAARDWPAARRLADRLLRAQPADQAARAIRAEVLFALGEHRLAAADYQALAVAEPEVVVYWGRWAECLYRAKDARGARAVLDRAIARQAASSLLLQRAMLSSVQRDYVAAEADIARAARLAPGDPALHMARAEVLHRQGRSQAARQAVDKLLAARPADLEGLLLRAEILHVLGDASAALDDAKQVASTHDPQGRAQALVAELHAVRGEREAAQLALSRARMMAPEARHVARAEALYSRLFRAPADAVRIIRHAVERFPDSRRLHQDLALALRDAGRGQEALALLDRLLEDEPDKATYNNRGRLLMQLGQLDRAIADFGRAMAIGKPLSLEHLNRGVARLRKKDTAGAIEDFVMAGRLDPSSASARYNLGNALYASGAVDRALAAYREAIQLDGGHFKAHYMRGVCHQRRGEHPQAIAAYGAALDARPAYPKALQARAQLLIASGKFEAAARDAERAIQIAPGKAFGYEMLISARGKQGRSDAALAVIEGVLRASPTNHVARLFRGMLHRGRKDYARALADLQAAVAAYDSLEGRLQLALVYRAQGDAARARAQFARARALARTAAERAAVDRFEGR